MLGVIARVGGPSSLLDLEPDIFIALLEGIARETPSANQILDDLYSQKAISAEAPTVKDPEARRSEIERLTRLFGG